MKIRRSELMKRCEEAQRLLAPCRLCPRRCRINRIRNEVGFCKAPLSTKIYSYRQYKGEEPPISGTKGSGVIFFTGCTMKCAYCQNSRFSQEGEGYTVDAEALCRIMLSLQKGGCHNINLVTPSHHLPTVLEGLLLAQDGSLKIPIVYNTSGYESKEVLELLSGVVDVYLADMRYSDNKLSRLYSMTKDYVEINRSAISVMHKQVGRLRINKYGIAEKGLIIRHLVLPNLLSNTEGVLKHISHSLPRDTHISLMSQYIPLYKAKRFRELSRGLILKEYETACALLEKYRLDCGWVQDF